MELYQALVRKRCFSRGFVVDLVGSDKKARALLERYLKEGSIERIRRDFYATINKETGEALPDPFQIASAITDEAYVSHTSVFEYYDILPKSETLYVASQKKLTHFYYQGIDYRFVPYRGNVISLENGIRLASLEQAVIDCMADMDKFDHLPHFLSAFKKMPQLSSDKLLEVLFQYNNKKLYQKVGCLFEALNNHLSLRKSFFARCQDEVSASEVPLFPIGRGFTLNKKWHVLAPDDIEAYIRKLQE